MEQQTRDNGSPPGGQGDPQGDPRKDPLYRAILAVLVASVLVGALLTLGGELVFASRPLASAGLGMAVIAGAAYWVLRLLGRRAAQRRGRTGGGASGRD